MPSVVGDVAHGYEIDSISMSPSTVEISGPESIVNATEHIYTTRINVSNAELNFSTETSFQQLNKLLTVMDEGPFKAEISVKPKVLERTFDSVQVEVINLAENLEINGELPLVTLKLSGNMPVLEDYILSKHAVQINMHDITEAGTYELPLRYVLPANLQLIEKSDEELTVNVIVKTENIEEKTEETSGEGQ